jgi:hypothetical protein
VVRQIKSPARHPNPTASPSGLGSQQRRPAGPCTRIGTGRGAGSWVSGHRWAALICRFLGIWDGRWWPAGSAACCSAPCAGATSWVWPGSCWCSGAAAVASALLAAVLTEIYLRGVCSCHERLRRNGRGQRLLRRGRRVWITPRG